MIEQLSVSPGLADLATRSGYAITPSDPSGAVVLWSTPGGEVRYFVRREPEGWVVLTRASRASAEETVLRAASIEIVEKHLASSFGIVVRDEIGLPYLRKPWNVGDVADGYVISEPDADGNRVLRSTGFGPIAQAYEATRSLMTLVPLSHLLQFSLVEIEESYRSDTGAPLLVDCAYSR